MPEHVRVVVHAREEVDSMAAVDKANESTSAQASFVTHPHPREECRVGPNEFRFWQGSGRDDRNLFPAHVA